MSFQETSWRRLCDQIVSLATPAGRSRTVAGIRIVCVDWGGAGPFEIDPDAVDLADLLMQVGDAQGWVGDTAVYFERMRRLLYVEGSFDTNPSETVMVYLVYRKVGRKPNRSKK